MSLASPDIQNDDFDELFQQFEYRLVNTDLLQMIKDRLIALFEIQGLVLKLNKPEVPNPMANFVLDFEPFLEQAI